MGHIERVFFAQGDDGAECIAILREHGARALLEHCKQWHYPGEHETSDSAGHGSADDMLTSGGYTLTWNSALEYVGLEYNTEHRELRRVERLHAVACRSLFFIDGTLAYERLTLCLQRLASAVHEFDGCGDTLWAIGENMYSLDDVIVGAFWHFTEWHAGQDSDSYAALSALGQVYNPNMETSDPDSDTYQALNTMAVQS